MKTKILILTIHILLSITFMQAQVVRTINVATPGTLSTLVESDKIVITGLTLTGTINDADFATIKQMTALKELDMSAVGITNGTIPGGAFQNKVMDKIIFPSSLQAIGNSAFAGMTIPNLDFSTCPNLQTIGIVAFNNIKLTNNVIDLSKQVQLVLKGQSFNWGHQGTFTGCPAEVILHDDKTVIEALSFYEFKGSVQLPAKLVTIEYRAFCNATLMKDLVLPSSLKVIRTGAFENATLPGLSFDKMGGQSGVICF